LQLGGNSYEYSQGKQEDLPTVEQVERIVPKMIEMADSGQYLNHNESDWFRMWPDHFQKQDWKCMDKAGVTFDADGTLRYCVEIPFSQKDKMFIWELESDEGKVKYAEIISRGAPCQGCLWDPAFETINRSRNPSYGLEQARDRFWHEVSALKASKLINGSGSWFTGNSRVRVVDPNSSVQESQVRAELLLEEAQLI
jgi:hypothetical protein